MIFHMSPIDRAGQSNPSDERGARSHFSSAHSVSPQTLKQYCSVVRRQPGVRPDVVARAKLLAADPNYPPVAVIRKLACQILAAPDLSEEI
jgi:hypothetical protein